MSEVEETLPAEAEEGGVALSGGRPFSPYREPGETTPPEADEEPRFLTPGEWAEKLGHIDPVVTPGGRANASECRAWMFAAAKVHNGWGTKLPDDVPLSREEYEAAVDSALNRPLGEVRTNQLLVRIEEQNRASASKEA